MAKEESVSKATVWEQMDRLVLRGGMAVGRPSCAKDKPASSGMLLLYMCVLLVMLNTEFNIYSKNRNPPFTHCICEYLKRFFGLKHLIST